MITIKRLVLVILFCKVLAVDGGEIFDKVYSKICYHFKQFCTPNGYPLSPLGPIAFPAFPIPPPVPPPITPPIPPPVPQPLPLPVPQVPSPGAPFPLPVVPGCPPYIIVCPQGSVSPTIAVPNIDIRLAAQVQVRTFNGCPCIDQRVGPALALGGLGGIGPGPVVGPVPLGPSIPAPGGIAGPPGNFNEMKLFHVSQCVLFENNIAIIGLYSVSFLPKRQTAVINGAGNFVAGIRNPCVNTRSFASNSQFIGVKRAKCFFVF